MSRVERITPPNLPKALGPYFPVTAIGDMLYISGQIGLDPVTNVVEHDDIEGQTHQTMKNLRSAVEGSDSSMSNIAKTTILLTDMNNFAIVNTIYETYFQPGLYPARACFAVVELPKNVKI